VHVTALAIGERVRISRQKRYQRSAPVSGFNALARRRDTLPKSRILSGSVRRSAVLPTAHPHPGWEQSHHSRRRHEVGRRSNLVRGNHRHAGADRLIDDHAQPSCSDGNTNTLASAKNAGSSAASLKPAQVTRGCTAGGTAAANAVRKGPSPTSVSRTSPCSWATRQKERINKSTPLRERFARSRENAERI